MASRALAIWETTQQVELDRLDAAHLAVGGAGPGRRTATQHINDAYIVLLAAHFQAFCRDLHTEAAEVIAASTPHVRIVKEALVLARQLDRGNVTPAALTADFRRLGVDVWTEMTNRDRRAAARRRRLDQLNVWRNAVAHRDFRLRPGPQATVVGTRRSLEFVQSCRACCRALARQMDAVVGAHLRHILGAPPW